LKIILLISLKRFFTAKSQQVNNIPQSPRYAAGFGYWLATVLLSSGQINRSITSVVRPMKRPITAVFLCPVKTITQYCSSNSCPHHSNTAGNCRNILLSRQYNTLGCDGNKQLTSQWSGVQWRACHSRQSTM